MFRLAPMILFILALVLPPPTTVSGQAIPTPFRWLGTDPVGFDAVVGPRAQAYGLGTVRMRLAWDRIEPTRGAGYRWESVDPLIAAAVAYDQRVVALITDNPEWAADSGQGAVLPEARNAYMAFLTAAAARYGGPKGRIDYWEIYNEPDAVGPPRVQERYVSSFGDDPSEYIDTLRRSRDAIRKADPAAKIVVGGLGLDWFTDQGGIFQRDFLPKLVHGGAFDYADGIAIHVYPNFAFNWTAWGPDIVGKVRYVRETLQKYGVDRPILITEYGFQAGGREESLVAQAEYVERSVVRLKAMGIVTALWFAPYDGPDFYYGLWRANNTPRPAATKFADTAYRLGNMSYSGVSPPGRVLSGTIESYRAIAFDGSFKVVMFAPTVTATMVLAPGVPRSSYTIDSPGDPTVAATQGQTITVGLRPIYLSYQPPKGGLIFVPGTRKG